MSLPLDKLNVHIDQLVLWLRENEGVKLLSAQKSRLTNILNKIINTETLSEIEIKQLDEQVKKQKQLEKQNAKSNKENSQKKLNTSKKRKKRKKTYQPRAHIVRGGLPSLGKRR